MEAQQKESYAQPVLVKHELLRDITATRSGKGHKNVYENWNNWSNFSHRGGRH